MSLMPFLAHEKEPYYVLLELCYVLVIVLETSDKGLRKQEHMLALKDILHSQMPE
jgi:hypothetical protein